MICSIDSLMGKLELRYSQLMRGVLNFQWAQSRTDGTFNARLHYVHWQNIKGFWKKDLKAFFYIQKNANELEPATINLQTDKHPWKKRGADLDF